MLCLGLRFRAVLETSRKHSCFEYLKQIVAVPLTNLHFAERVNTYHVDVDFSMTRVFIQHRGGARTPGTAGDGVQVASRPRRRHFRKSRTVRV